MWTNHVVNMVASWCSATNLIWLYEHVFLSPEQCMKKECIPVAQVIEDTWQILQSWLLQLTEMCLLKTLPLADSFYPFTKWCDKSISYNTLSFLYI